MIHETGKVSSPLSDAVSADLKKRGMKFAGTVIIYSYLHIGICTFLIIGLFHPVVVKAEYYWGTKCWWIFLILGIAGVAASLSVDNVILSSLLGVFAFSSFWTIKEVFEQEDRVRKGWFPKNPKRKYKF